MANSGGTASIMQVAVGEDGGLGGDGLDELWGDAVRVVLPMDLGDGAVGEGRACGEGVPPEGEPTIEERRDRGAC